MLRMSHCFNGLGVAQDIIVNYENLSSVEQYADGYSSENFTNTSVFALCLLLIN